MAAAETQMAPMPASSGIKAVAPNQPRIPIVGHTITDEEMGLLMGSKVEPVNLHRLIKLLLDPHSAMLYDRHIHALKKAIKHYQKGFIMKDLVHIFKILNICTDRVEEQPFYIEPLIEMLKIASLPFLKEKTSDELSYEQIAIESVSQLGYLMRVPNQDVRQEICRTLISFYTQKPPKQEVQKHQASRLSFNQMVVEKSDVSETLVKSLALLEADLEVRISVLKVLQKFSKKSSLTCDQMLKANGAEKLCQRMNDPDPSCQLLFRSVDILWNLLENGETKDIAQQLNNAECIEQLRDAFIQQLTQGYSHYDMQLRNDLVVLASLVASMNESAPFVETGFVKQLTLLSTFEEVKSHHALVKHLKYSKSHEDFELKKLLINILVVLSKNQTTLPIYSEGHLILALFSYVRPNEEKAAGSQEWTAAQFEEIQLHAMAALSTLSPLMLDDFMTCQGGTRLLLLLEWCVGPTKYGGHGNSFHGAGGRSNKRAQMRHCLRLIRSVISTGEESVIQDFVDQGVINQLTGILNSVSLSDEADDAVDVEMQCDMLFILSAICDTDMHRKELFGNSGVDVLIRYMKINPKKFSSGLGHHRLMLATVDTIWCTVIGSYTTEEYFMECEGVFLLFDLLESCPKSMHNLILGCLLDLAENRKTIAHINTWRGKDESSAAHLLCNMWRDEEQEMGVHREESGTISDLNRPLMGQLQASMGVVPQPASHPSQAIVDVSENMRAKIYALFSKLGFVELPGLTTQDHVTLSIVERYLDFKLGEVWTEIIEELGQEGVRPVTPDQEALETIQRAVEERAQGCAMTQAELLEAQHSQNLMDEQEFYAQIRENHRQQEKALTDFADYVARTSHYQLLKAAKERQDMSIDASRIQSRYKESATFHGTDLTNLITTTFSGRHVAVESTPIKITGGFLKNQSSSVMTGSSGSKEKSPILVT